MIDDSPIAKVVDDFPYIFRKEIFRLVSNKLWKQKKWVQRKVRSEWSEGYDDFEEELVDEKFMSVKSEFLDKLKDFSRKSNGIRVEVRFDEFDEWERFLQNGFLNSIPSDFWHNLSVWVIIIGDLPEILKKIKNSDINYYFDSEQNKFMPIQNN